jgi:hypothetical protein
MNGEWKFSEQKGRPGHCFVAQVWDADGNCLAVIEPTEDPAVATERAMLFACSPALLRFVSDMISGYDHEGRDSCYPSCRVCAAEKVLARYEAMKAHRLGED